LDPFLRQLNDFIVKYSNDTGVYLDRIRLSIFSFRNKIVSGKRAQKQGKKEIQNDQVANDLHRQEYGNAHHGVRSLLIVVVASETHAIPHCFDPFSTQNPEDDQEGMPKVCHVPSEI
jgi:hypothetical protein